MGLSDEDGEESVGFLELEEEVDGGAIWIFLMIMLWTFSHAV